tara:strand:+ start:2562 stop:4430 length:1869 start_codon:yes stop_codon:yes gene_type:complete
MPLEPLLFKPGINKESTSYTAEGGWFDGNLVRFKKGYAEKIGGWQKYLLVSYEGTGRKLHNWVNLGGSKLLGLGTRFKLYIQEGANFNDITPLRSTTAAGDVTFAASNGSSTITVTDASHGAAQNDFVTFSGAVSLGGVITAAVLNHEYQVVSIVNGNSYTFLATDANGNSVTANGSDTGNGGGSTVGKYQIGVGLDVFVGSTGWGADTWGNSTWGSTSSLAANNQLRLWSMDNFGEDLIANPRAGSVYYWANSGGVATRGVALSDLAGSNLAPTRGLQVIVSDVDRHALVLGADPISNSTGLRSGSIDPLLIAFSNQEDITDWEPRSDNTAGSLRCSAGSEIIGGIRARQETLIWTDVALYSLQFIGTPLTFGLNLINEGVTLIGPNCAVNTPAGVFWMDRKGFYKYSGTVQSIKCSVQSYVYSDFNQSQSYQFFGFVNKEFNEVGWFYCSSSTTVIDRYVTYNYVEDHWSIGQMSRTAWIDEGVSVNPIAAGKSSSTPYLYSHEVGNDDDGSAMASVYIQSGDFDIGNGQDFQFIKRMIPDINFNGTGGSGQAVDAVLKVRNYPGDSLATEQTTSFTGATTKIDMRARGRQAALRFQSSAAGVGFRLGNTRLDLQPNGKR